MAPLHRWGGKNGRRDRAAVQSTAQTYFYDTYADSSSLDYPKLYLVKIILPARDS